MAPEPAVTHGEIPQMYAPVTVVVVPNIRSFIEELRNDAPRIRHREARWLTETVTSSDEYRVIFELLTAGYIADDGTHPKLVELRLPCGRLGLTRREQDIAAQEQLAAALQVLQDAAKTCGLDWRPGRFTTEPSPLMATTADTQPR
ncbi:MAG TPA: hypothetical protein VGL78_04240 [Solirubrobacteraceae bacterium]